MRELACITTYALELMINDLHSPLCLFIMSIQGMKLFYWNLEMPQMKSIQLFLIWAQQSVQFQVIISNSKVVVIQFLPCGRKTN